MHSLATLSLQLDACINFQAPNVVVQNCLETCAAHPDLLLSASADETVRLTNMRTGAPLATFFGDEGHLAEVLHVAWQPHQAVAFCVRGAGRQCDGLEHAAGVRRLNCSNVEHWVLRNLSLVWLYDVCTHTANRCTAREFS